MDLGLGVRALGAVCYLGSESPCGSVYGREIGTLRHLSSAPRASGGDTESDTAGSGLAFVFLIFRLHGLKPHARVGYYYDRKPVPFMIFVRRLGGRPSWS